MRCLWNFLLKKYQKSTLYWKNFLKLRNSSHKKKSQVHRPCFHFWPHSTTVWLRTASSHTSEFWHALCLLLFIVSKYEGTPFNKSQHHNLSWEHYVQTNFGVSIKACIPAWCNLKYAVDLKHRADWKVRNPKDEADQPNFSKLDIHSEVPRCGDRFSSPSSFSDFSMLNLASPLWYPMLGDQMTNLPTGPPAEVKLNHTSMLTTILKYCVYFCFNLCQTSSPPKKMCVFFPNSGDAHITMANPSRWPKIVGIARVPVPGAVGTHQAGVNLDQIEGSRGVRPK